MELKDIIGPGYPCKNCGVNKINHPWSSGKLLCSHEGLTFEAERIGLVLNFDALKDSPLEDLASRLKSL